MAFKYITREREMAGVYLTDGTTIAPTQKGQNYWLPETSRFLPILNMLQFTDLNMLQFTDRAELRLADTEQTANDIATYNAKTNNYSLNQNLVNRNRLDVSTGDFLFGEVRMVLNFMDTPVTVKTRSDIPKLFQPLSSTQLDDYKGKLIVLSFHSFNTPKMIKDISGLANYFENLRLEEIQRGEENTSPVRMFEYLSRCWQEFKPEIAKCAPFNSIKLAMIHSYSPSDFIHEGVNCKDLYCIESAMLFCRTIKIIEMPPHPKLSDSMVANTQIVQSLRDNINFADTRSARLPLLDTTQFTDPNKGLWEFWGMDPQELQKLGVRARNPVADLRDCNVAIDFGTSSTVVAYDDNGTHKLLRIGVTDFFEAVKTAHYENPTVLEFVDFEAMRKPWCSEAYRPAVLWDDVRCSHEALHNFRNNDTKPEVVASILTKIKQWALREGNNTRLRVTDQTHRIEHELAPLTLRQPVKGRPLEVSDTDPFDPVELYAWFLGLTINWRGRGLFLRYYMTFPVAYENAVKDKIVASFRRGLQRSLPLALVTQPEFEQFTVEARASEPAAYAATALRCLNIEPTSDGVAYAVFDFGGGTTDFDFGYYRLPTETEADDEGWETVFEHFGSGGDAFLGGENLLEHLAYRTLCHNIEVCRKHKITFTKPLDAQDFPGSELFLERTQAAATNSLMLMARLRSFWESGETSNKTGVEKIDLLGRDGKKVPCEFLIPFDVLNKYLQDRIAVGIHNFYAALKKAFADQMPQQVQVLLAGNASRSKSVQGFFGLLDTNDPLQALKSRTDEFVAGLFGEHPPVFTIHPPLLADESDVYRPTGKTGVALGLLRLCPGSSTLVINHAAKNVLGDASFLHYIGRIRMGKFHVCLPQGAPYQKWVELGQARERVFYLVHSQEPRAHLGEMKDGEVGLHQKRLEMAGNTTGLRVYGRAVSPHEIDLCTAASADAAENGQMENLRRVKLG